MSHLYHHFPHFYWCHAILRKVQGFYQCWEFTEEQSSDRECEDNLSSQPSPIPVLQPSLQTRGKLRWGQPFGPTHCQPHHAYRCHPGSSLVVSWLNSFSHSMTSKLKISSHVKWFNFIGAEEEAMASDEQMSMGKFMSCLSSLHQNLRG